GEISLIVSSQVCEPGVWRIWNPVVVLPDGMDERLSDEELEAVMMHELIHIQRRDNLLTTFQMLICCFFWFHPLVWMIDRRLLAEREMVCDEDVIRYIGEPQIYAASLWKVAQFGLGWSFAGVSRATGSNLKRRIELMLTTDHKSKISSARAALSNRMVAVGMVAAMITFSITIGWLGSNLANAQQNRLSRPDAQDGKSNIEVQRPTKVRLIEGAPDFPMQFENQNGAPVSITDARVKAMVDEEKQLSRSEKEAEVIDLMVAQFNVTLVNQTDRRIKEIRLEFKNPGIIGKSFRIGLFNLSVDPFSSYTFGKAMLHQYMTLKAMPDAPARFTVEVIGVKFETGPDWGIITSSREGQLPNHRQRPDRGGDQLAVIQTGQGVETIEPMSSSLRPTILYKEKAIYTEEARQNKVEGAVVLSVVFNADGRITGLQVVRGLPDGLTERAIEAAQKIRFEPAIKDNQRISVRGNLEYNFSLDLSGKKSSSNQGEGGRANMSDKREESNEPAARSSKFVTDPAVTEYVNRIAQNLALHSDANEIIPMGPSLRPTITYKEKASYTPEARANNVSGTVVLRVVFGSDGKMRDISVVRGLPYGLTEQAISAAMKIRFEPALRDGKPVSVRGNLEFTFNL
ncbi:MAG: M56 family metallopeptidase, partial [Acidobacteria bacterium]|nr:M56 family metallopeptidase [Acidobacteriota bacterium]